ncbi:MAG: type II secretion system minor pseudopilin GspK [Spongiibacteraceae bacterium]
MNRKISPATSVNPQRGAALIVALLVVATVVVLATTLSGDFLLMFRRVENQLHSEQAYAYLLGAEGVARAALLRDKQTGSADDNLFEEWAKPQKFPTDYGWIAGQLEDLQGRFNLNSVVAKKQTGQPNPVARDESQQILLRLLLALPLQQPLAGDEADALVDAITDWIDGDDNVSGLGGAESQHYAAAEPPGLPANRALASPSELMWVRGMTPEIYRALEGVVTVWPKTGGPINLNTAPAGVLAAINGPKTLVPLEPSVLDKLLAERKAKQTLDIEAVNALLTDQMDAAGKAQYGSESDYFQLTAQTEFLGRRYTLRSVLHRGKKDVRVVARTFGEW